MKADDAWDDSVRAEGDVVDDDKDNDASWDGATSTREDDTFISEEDEGGRPRSQTLWKQ